MSASASRERETVNEQTVIDNATRCGEAYQRGYERGLADEQANYYNGAPLSGEWAGESVSEIIGDLVNDAADEWEQQWEISDGDSVGAGYFLALSEYAGDITDELSEHYERGYLAAFSHRVFCDTCGGLCDPTYAVSDDVLAYCGQPCEPDNG